MDNQQSSDHQGKVILASRSFRLNRPERSEGDVHTPFKVYSPTGINMLGETTSFSQLLEIPEY